MTEFEEWLETYEKAYGIHRTHRETARAGWEARQKLDAELCRALSAECARAIETTK